MSYNLLRDLPRNGFLGLDTLETLDLSFNDLRKIDEKTFESMRWLTILKVGHFKASKWGTVNMPRVRVLLFQK
jgi:hypothetical protein